MRASEFKLSTSRSPNLKLEPKALTYVRFLQGFKGCQMGQEALCRHLVFTLASLGVEHWIPTRNFIWPRSNTCKGALVSLWLRCETLDLRGVEIGKKLCSALTQTLERDQRVGGHCLFIECMGRRFCAQVNNLLSPIINKMSIRSIL